jgi:hypothetical protein
MVTEEKIVMEISGYSKDSSIGLRTDVRKEVKRGFWENGPES